MTLRKGSCWIYFLKEWSGIDTGCLERGWIPYPGGVQEPLRCGSWIMVSGHGGGGLGLGLRVLKGFSILMSLRFSSSTFMVHRNQAGETCAYCEHGPCTFFAFSSSC